ncbi:MAG: hypothetical protein A3H96_25690 [Acidobacteria bacterium RIFCSPLOWO2_02_FULL_67_36]|nr:MAG: hypothetical protein A3H96_25690 [Acidobacteria bacterium RIFCSPLOWO2_02_FULL_67_36]OFW22563.1 MAG: hypothetical protein A3G21_13740 [Acidobacteria bacterium RIFCSPLOWO2_12_FULL_66_21]
MTEELVQDVRYAIRTLGRSPGFAAVAVLTLALGIGANSAVFTVVNGVLLRPMPFPEPDRLFLVSLAPVDGPFRSGPVLTDRHYLEFRAQDRQFEQIATFSTSEPTLTGAGDPIRISDGTVTPEFFDVLRVQPQIGRGFQAGDGQPGTNPVVLLSDRIWRMRFNADPRALGTLVRLDGVAHEVIGVMPPGMTFPSDAQVWTPVVVRLDPHNSWMRPVVGRLRRGVSRREAQAELDVFARQPGRVSAQDRDVWRPAIVPLKELLIANVRSSLLIFTGAVGFVLLIACTNVAHLLLTRATGRRQEMAVRAALGAGRARLVRQLLTEGLMISLAGGAAGVVLAMAGVPALIALAPLGTFPRLEMIRIDGWVLAFTLVVSVLTGIGAGLVPALRATRQAVSDTLNQGGRSVAGGHERLRNALAVAEVALALILLTGAGLMLKSFLRLRAVDPGFTPDHAITLTVDLPNSAYGSAASMQTFHTALLGRLSVLPDVVAAGAVNWRPLGSALIRGDVVLEGDRKVPDGFLVDKPAVTPGYFRAMGIHLHSGRDFMESDGAAAPGVVIVSQSAGRALWPNEDPIGGRVSLQDDPTPADWLTVVGIVDDVKQQGLAKGADPAIYQPYRQVKGTFFLSHMTFAVRTTADPALLAPAMRAVLHDTDANLPAQSIATMPDLIAATTAEPRFQTRLLTVLAVLALTLAVLGMYGVLAYAVALRRREFGIRMALGAQSADVVDLVLRRTLALAGTGIVIGSGGAIALTRVLDQSGFLFDVRPTDPTTFALVALGVLVMAVVAGLIPARRARRLDPMVAMRAE